jgi:membrane protein
VSLLVTAALFAVIFKVLPDASTKWKDVLPGAIVSAVLFIIGKFAVSLYISQSNISSTYGAAGSLVILLLWVYFSSLVLYFGAEFTKSWAMNQGHSIQPNDYAVTVKKVEMKQGA